jgi:hypothetical protein
VHNVLLDTSGDSPFTSVSSRRIPLASDMYFLYLFCRVVKVLTLKSLKVLVHYQADSFRLS